MTAAGFCPWPYTYTRPRTRSRLGKGIRRDSVSSFALWRCIHDDDIWILLGCGASLLIVFAGDSTSIQDPKHTLLFVWSVFLYLFRFGRHDYFHKDIPSYVCLLATVHIVDGIHANTKRAHLRATIEKTEKLFLRLPAIWSRITETISTIRNDDAPIAILYCLRAYCSRCSFAVVVSIIQPCITSTSHSSIAWISVLIFCDSFENGSLIQSCLSISQTTPRLWLEVGMPPNQLFTVARRFRFIFLLFVSPLVVLPVDSAANDQTSKKIWYARMRIVHTTEIRDEIPFLNYSSSDHPSIDARWTTDTRYRNKKLSPKLQF